jgi:hypothetical protein
LKRKQYRINEWDGEINEARGELKMETAKKPIEKYGRRNVFCPHYGTCLDYAISQSWDVWGCGECEYISLKEPREEIFYGGEATVAYYTLSREVSL